MSWHIWIEAWVELTEAVIKIVTLGRVRPLWSMHLAFGWLKRQGDQDRKRAETEPPA